MKKPDEPPHGGKKGKHQLYLMSCTRHCPLSLYERLIWSAAVLRDQRGKSLSRKAIAKMTGLSIWTVRNGVKRLRWYGLLIGDEVQEPCAFGSRWFGLNKKPKKKAKHWSHRFAYVKLIVGADSIVDAAVLGIVQALLHGAVGVLKHQSDRGLAVMLGCDPRTVSAALARLQAKLKLKVLKTKDRRFYDIDLSNERNSDYLFRLMAKRGWDSSVCQDIVWSMVSVWGETSTQPWCWLHSAIEEAVEVHRENQAAGKYKWMQNESHLVQSMARTLLTKQKKSREQDLRQSKLGGALLLATAV